VPALDGIPDHPKTPDAARLFPKIAPELRPIPRIALPAPIEPKPCSECDGRGYRHDCPDCTCACEDCWGTGKDEVIQPVPVLGASFARRYVALIYALPGNLFGALGVTPKSPMFFRFDGGEGMLMPLNITPQVEVGETP